MVKKQNTKHCRKERKKIKLTLLCVVFLQAREDCYFLNTLNMMAYPFSVTLLIQIYVLIIMIMLIIIVVIIMVIISNIVILL